jgi:hypothetical protein
MMADPFSGAVYVFRAKRADRIKLIFWDGTGLCLFAKRLEASSWNIRCDAVTPETDRGGAPSSRVINIASAADRTMFAEHDRQTIRLPFSLMRSFASVKAS